MSNPIRTQKLCKAFRRTNPADPAGGRILYTMRSSMKQTIHIFLKDTRRSWPYIAVVLALTATLTVLTPKWVPVYGRGTKTVNGLVDMLDFLLPMAWWFTIAHVVHGEGLVGDKQFWVTRPYSWKSLFAAKLLFCATFLVLPHFVFDWIILSGDGFSPEARIPVLLWRQCYEMGILMLPAFVLAAVTSGMRQFVLVCLVLAAALFLMIQVQVLHPSNAIVSALPDAIHAEGRSWVKEWYGTVLYASGVMALLLWLYARRRTTVARAIVLAALAWSLVDTAWPPSAIAWASQKQLAPAEYPEVAVVFAPEHGHLGMAGATSLKGKVQVDIPIAWTGRNRDLLDAEMASVSVSPERSAAWTSGWNWYVHDSERGGTDWIEIHLAPDVFERLKSGPVRVRAVFGAIVYETQTTTTLRPGSGWTSVPGFGEISLRTDSDYPGQYPFLWWRVPLRYPEQKAVFSMRDPDSGAEYRGELSGSYPAAPALASMSPATFYATGLEWRGSGQALQRPPSARSLCEFTVERPIALIRRDIEIPNIRIGDYAVGASERGTR
jgi:hypothetical protein